MDRPAIIRVIRYVVWFGAPAAVVGVALAAAGQMGWAALGWMLLAVLAGVTVLAWLAVREGRRLHRFAQHLARWSEGAPDGPMPRQPGLLSELGRDIAVDIAQLVRLLRRRERAERRALDSANTILEALHDPLFLVRPDRTVARCNAAAIDQFGEHLVDRDLAAYLRHPEVLRGVDAVLAGGAPQVMQVRQTVPVERVFEARLHPIPWTMETPPDSEEEPSARLGALVKMHDITAMARAQQLRTDFIANASHELRTPLSALMGFIETLSGPARDDPQAQERFLSIMEEQAQRMSRLVDDLMSLSRIEQDEHTPPTESVDLAQVLDRIARGLELRSRERDMPIEVELPADLPVLPGDADQLVQVFQNLVDNALKYGRKGEPVTVSATVERQGRRPPQIRVAVRDRGPGIPREHLPRLTERFFRVDAARSRALGGTGLGLAIVKHIISRHRGRLQIESVEGEGTTVTVLLPVARGRGLGDALAEPAQAAQ